MNTENYFEMDMKKLYENLITKIMSDSKSGKILLDQLSKAKHYKNNYEFRATVDTAMAVLQSMSEERENNFILCNNLIERTTALELWDLALVNWNLLGNLYAIHHISERAFECYNNIIKIETAHKINFMTSNAYNSIGFIFMNLNLYKEANNYYSMAIKALDKTQANYYQKLITYKSGLIMSLYALNKKEDVKNTFLEMQQIDFNILHNESKYYFCLAEMFYTFSIGLSCEYKNIFYKAKSYISPNDSLRIAALLNTYIEECIKINLDYTFYLEELMLAEKITHVNSIPLNIEIYEKLRKYYQTINDKAGIERTTEKYIEYLEKNVENTHKQNAHSLQTIIELMKGSDTNEVTSRNIELKLIADEAVRNKNALQEAYQQIEMINEIGKQMTASLNLSKVVDLIYQNLNDNLPIDVFVLMLVETEKNQVRSLAYYEDNILQPELIISLNDPSSVFVDCYKINQLIFSDDIKYKEYFKERKELQDDVDRHSSIFMPMNVENKIIGLCSIQYRKAGVYTDKHIIFLKQLLPYLSIALNNAIHSWTLEKEIKFRLSTQAKLEAANKRLEHLYSLDGLTRISSRRNFDIKIIKLFKKAQTKQLPISIIMLDIDNFKLYNDTYGHLEGDEALKKVAQIFQKDMDKVHGLSARFGGEEFIGAFIGLDSKQSEAFVNTLREDIYNLRIEHKAVPLKILSVSIGIAFAEDPDSSQKSYMMKTADTSLYQAKNSGRNKVVMQMI